MMEANLRAQILAEPEKLLDDRDIMAALMSAHERQMGGNVFDLRSIAMERLEGQLSKLEDVHRDVISAAYDNLAGAYQINRAVLRLMEATDFAGLMTILSDEMPDVLRIKALALVLAPDVDTHFAALAGGYPGLMVKTAEFLDSYAHSAEGAKGNRAVDKVVLRGCSAEGAMVYGSEGADIRSEALMMLDFGGCPARGMLVLGSDDVRQFQSSHGTEFLTFFAAVLERIIARLLV